MTFQYPKHTLSNEKWETRDQRRIRNMKATARWNGRVLLYGLAPIMLIAPLVGPMPSRWWEWAGCWVVGVCVAGGSVALIRWGRNPFYRSPVLSRRPVEGSEDDEAEVCSTHE
ncbi:MAG: hypothetical protein D8M59_09585 [Planctomycetes bacterium]|nr:hypothetical protein [Planctomycetota bacterium]